MFSGCDLAGTKMVNDSNHDSSTEPIEPALAVKIHARGKSRWLLIAMVAFWVLAIAAGMQKLETYELSPGIAAKPPLSWPADSQIPPAIGRDTLVLVAHPHCPCTRASIGELALIMAHCRNRVSAYVLFLSPSGFSKDWTETDLLHSAAAIPDVHVISDKDGLEARVFHSETSGQVLLYDSAGRLQFSGGITSSRGHSGDNLGRDSIVAIVNRGKGDVSETSVFGCPLFNTTAMSGRDQLCKQ